MRLRTAEGSDGWAENTDCQVGPDPEKLESTDVGLNHLTTSTPASFTEYSRSTSRHSAT